MAIGQKAAESTIWKKPSQAIPGRHVISVFISASEKRFQLLHLYIYTNITFTQRHLMLAACANCTQDPSQAGFFCGIRNIAEGTYEHRQAALKSEAEQAETEAQQRGDQVRTLQSQEASLTVEKKQLQTKRASIQVDLGKQKRLLAETRLQQQADRSKLAELETRLKALQYKRTQLGQSATASPQEVETLKRDIQHLQNKINEVLKLTAVE